MNLFQAIIKIADLEKRVDAYYRGKQFRVLSNYNGQPYGRSKHSLKGKILTVSYISLDGGHAYIFPEGYRLALRENEVEFIDG